MASYLRQLPFSITLDESTSTSNQRVLTLLTHLWQMEKLVCLHLRSVELTLVNAETITKVILDTIDTLIFLMKM